MWERKIQLCYLISDEFMIILTGPSALCGDPRPVLSITISLVRKIISMHFCALDIPYPLLQSLSVDNFTFYFTVGNATAQKKVSPFCHHKTYQPLCIWAHVILPALRHGRTNCPGCYIRPTPRLAGTYPLLPSKELLSKN